MVSWGGHRANGEGGLRPSSNAELSIFGPSLELFSPGLPATSTLHPWPQHGSQRLPLGCHAGAITLAPTYEKRWHQTPNTLEHLKGYQ